MSNIYHTEPVTSGKVILHTSVGDFDVELWTTEAPVACRNFVQLCMEGYYDGVIFHRVIEKFMAQTGDPSGTGNGGESIYGRPFKDEFHQRLRFNHRGQVAMANPNQPDCNQSQFFITLGPCEWLNKKHTIFAKVTGNTVYNLAKFSDIETNKDTDRPLEPPKIISTEVISTGNLGQVEPRFHRSHQQEKEKEIERKRKEREEETKVSKKKNKALISFDDDDDDDDSFLPKSKKSKNDATKPIPKISLNPLLQASNVPPNETTVIQKLPKPSASTASGTHNSSDSSVADTEKVRLTPAQNTIQDNVDGDDGKQVSDKRKEKQELKRRAKERVQEMAAAREAARVETAAKQVDVGSVARNKVKAKADEGLMSAVEQRRMKYLQKQKDVKSRQRDTLAMLNEFKAKLSKAQSQTQEGIQPTVNKQNAPTQIETGVEKYKGGIGDNLSQQEIENLDNDDDGPSWMTTKLHFKRHVDDEHRMRGAFNPTADDYEVIDPRTSTGQSALRKMKHSGSNSNHRGHRKSKDRR